MRQREAERELQELRAKAGVKAPGQVDDEWEPPRAPARVQEVIDQVPQLLAWQLSKDHQAHFQMAAEFDEALRHDPIWKTKPAAARFAEAAARTAAHLGGGAPVDPAAAAAAAIAAADPQRPTAIHDFRGGSAATAPARNLAALSDEAILATLDPNGS
jgi:hypothetical protein